MNPKLAGYVLRQAGVPMAEAVAMMLYRGKPDGRIMYRYRLYGGEYLLSELPKGEQYPYRVMYADHSNGSVHLYYSSEPFVYWRRLVNGYWHYDIGVPPTAKRKEYIYNDETDLWAWQGGWWTVKPEGHDESYYAIYCHENYLSYVWRNHDIYELDTDTVCYAESEPPEQVVVTDTGE